MDEHDYRESSVDEHDYRSDFNWILENGFDWVITDTADDSDVRLRAEGRRNIKYLLQDGKEEADQALCGWAVYEEKSAGGLCVDGRGG